MEESTAIIPSRPDAPLPALAVVAIAAEDFAPAQRRLIDLCEHHIREQSLLAAEMDESLAIAKKNKWRQRGIAKAGANAKKLVVFYSNIKAALEAGYFLMPNLDCDVYAVRTNRPGSVPGGTMNRWRHADPLPVVADKGLPTGVGDYVSDVPLSTFYASTRTEDGKEIKEYVTEPIDTQAVEVPLILARPQLMHAAERTMALRIFDEVGIVGADRRSRRADPMLVGRILHPVTRDSVRTFFLAWWMDPRSL